MSYRNFNIVILSFILIFSSNQGICKNICRMNYGAALEEPNNVQLERNNCTQYMIKDAYMKSEVFCLDACYRTEECNSVYYERKTSYCILYRRGDISNVCLKSSQSSHAYYARFNRVAFREMVSENLIHCLFQQPLSVWQ